LKTKGKTLLQELDEMIERFERAKEVEQKKKHGKWDYYMGCVHGLRNAVDILRKYGRKK